MCSNLVHKLDCKNSSKSYVGQTAQWLISRIALHNSDNTKGKACCTLANHVFDCSCNIDFDNVKILVPSYKTRLIWKMININKQEECIKKPDIQNLCTIYTYLVSFPNKNNEYCGPI